MKSTRLHVKAEFTNRCNQILTNQLARVPPQRRVELNQMFLEIPKGIIAGRRINKRDAEQGERSTFATGPAIPHHRYLRLNVLHNIG
jgi:hypothetical protein